MEARLVKDIQPRFNVELKDDKSFPYLQIRIREEYPRVEFTRSPRRRGVKLYGPFTSAKTLRYALQVLQRIFKFRNCSLDIRTEEQRWRWFRPCILHSINRCTAPCNFRVTPEEYRRQIRALRLVLEGKKDRLIAEMEKEMQEASAALLFEKAARLRDDIAALKNLGLRGDVNRDVQPEVFPIEPKKGLIGLRKVLGLAQTPRTIEGLDIAHLGGSETVASVVTFLDGLPFKPGYRRYRLRTVEGVDDFASIREVVTRRFRGVRRALSQPAPSVSEGSEEEQVFPDILLIDGGKGQLNAAREAFGMLGVEPPCLIALAKREEEIYRPDEAAPLRLSRHSAALRLLQYVRDEAHRFAQHYHHLLRRKKLQEE
jgi:excinuclease ABC subunit C